jgi:hypothetical protein
MGITVQQEKGGLVVVRITGLLKKSEMDSAFKSVARKWGPSTRVKTLVVVEDFEGFERGANWGDISFLVQYDPQIDRIAIVGDPNWEGDLLTFAGAGFRQGQIRYFPTAQIAQARAWLG